MTNNNRVVFVDRLNRALTAWKQMRPTKKFGEMTADSFEAEVHKAVQARNQQVEAEKIYQQALLHREETERDARAVLKKVINGIKGDVREGPDGEFYRACGYIPDSERRRALTRKRRGSSDSEAPADTASTDSIHRVAAA